MRFAVIAQAAISDDAAFVLLMILLCSPVVLIGMGIAWWIIRSNRMQGELRDREIQKTLYAEQLPGQRVKKQRNILKNCTNCREFCLHLPVIDQLGRTYCSQECMLAVAKIPLAAPQQSAVGSGPPAAEDLFCDTCIKCTSDAKSWPPISYYGVGIRLGAAEDQCPRCCSMRKSLYFAIFFIPIFRIGRYRVLHVDRMTYYSRKLFLQ